MQVDILKNLKKLLFWAKNPAEMGENGVKITLFKNKKRAHLLDKPFILYHFK